MSPGAEAAYFDARDRYIARFKTKPPTTVEAKAATDDLEKRLRTLLGAPKGATINLETLVEDGGFGQADGLNYKKGADRVFVTSKAILRRYVAENKYLPQDFEQLAASPVFFARVFSWDAAFHNFAALPVQRGWAFLTLQAQDIGAFTPQFVVTWAEKGEKLALSTVDVASVVKPIAKCQAVWDEYEKKAEPLHPTMVEEAHKLEEKGFTAFGECFGKAVKNEPYYAALVARAQKSIDGLP